MNCPRHQNKTAWLKLLPYAFLPAVLLGLVSACAPAFSSASPNPTAFVATRVVMLLTQNAATDTARRTPTAPDRPPSKTPPSVVTVTDAPPTAALAAAPPVATPLAAATPVAATSVVTALTGALPAPAADVPKGPCKDQACASAVGHFWLERPIPEGYVNYPDWTYPYGGTMGGQREPHHGVEFVNASGTPIIAAGPGQVVVAGNDHTAVYGPTTDFYGNLVVVQLDQTFDGQPVFNLYGHLKSYSVTVGQHVNTGDRLGLVGATGVAIGPHLHFEVRVGANNYASSRNPELWLKPLRYNGVYQGAIAGRVVDTHNNLVSGYSLVIRPIAVESDNPHSRYVTTYTPDGLGIQGDDHLVENFGITDMPLGMYLVGITTSKSYQQVITVATGSLTWVTFVVEPPPLTATATFTSTVTATP